MCYASFTFMGALVFQCSNLSSEVNILVWMLGAGLILVHCLKIEAARLWVCNFSLQLAKALTTDTNYAGALRALDVELFLAGALKQPQPEVDVPPFALSIFKCSSVVRISLSRHLKEIVPRACEDLKKGHLCLTRLLGPPFSLLNCGCTRCICNSKDACAADAMGWAFRGRRKHCKVWGIAHLVRKRLQILCMYVYCKTKICV